MFGARPNGQRHGRSWCIQTMWGGMREKKKVEGKRDTQEAKMGKTQKEESLFEITGANNQEKEGGHAAISEKVRTRPYGGSRRPCSLSLQSRGKSTKGKVCGEDRIGKKNRLESRGMKANWRNGRRKSASRRTRPGQEDHRLKGRENPEARTGKGGERR